MDELGAAVGCYVSCGGIEMSLLQRTFQVPHDLPVDAADDDDGASGRCRCLPEAPATQVMAMLS